MNLLQKQIKIREQITQHNHQDTILTIPYGNYSVYSFMDKLNESLLNKSASRIILQQIHIHTKI